MKDKFRKFINGNGFLVFLFICVCIVSFSTISLLVKDSNNFKKDRDKESYKEAIEGQTDKTGQVSDGVGKKDDEDKKEDEDLKDGKKEEDNLEDKDNPESREDSGEINEINDDDLDTEAELNDDYIETSQILEDKPSFTLPLEGEIITEFAKDTLIYSKTLEEWRGHPGIDIKGNLGTKVLAAADGHIKDIYEDSLWGNIVVIDHGKGLLSKYANLDEGINLKLGQEVKQGEVIASVGKSAKIEVLMDDHLHFEVIRDGKNIDPRSIKE